MISHFIRYFTNTINTILKSWNTWSWWSLELGTHPWASYQINKIAGCACAGNAGNVFPRRRFKRKPLVSDPSMHHGTCVTHVPWCMSGSLTCGDGENVPGIPGACAPAILRIWQEAHWQKDHFWTIISYHVTSVANDVFNPLIFDMSMLHNKSSWYSQSNLKENIWLLP